MARTERIYRRLPGRLAGAASYYRLWLGPDHLLSVRATGYSEEYKRFYYQDIQAIILRRTLAWRNWNFGLGTAAGLVCFVSVLSSGGVALGIWLSLAGALFLLFLVNLARGPSCVCHVRTAVQTERLPTLGRVRLARKVIDRVRPLIERAQGPAAPEAAQPDSPAPLPAGASPPTGEANQPPPTDSVP